MRSAESEALSILGLARRAGVVVVGVAAVRRAMDSGDARLVLTARDASATQLRKLGTPHERNARGVLEVADGARLGAALGSGPLSAVAVTEGKLANRVAECFGRTERSDDEVVGPRDRVAEARERE